MSSSSTWTAQLDRLAIDHRVIAPDLFGHGASAKPAGDYSLSAHAASLRDLFDSLGIADGPWSAIRSAAASRCRWPTSSRIG
jgi:pimeloyl-ACP methyl ester carboxylesterase